MEKIKSLFLKPIRRGRVSKIKLENRDKDDCVWIYQDGDVIFIEKKNVDNFIKLLTDISK